MGIVMTFTQEDIRKAIEWLKQLAHPAGGVKEMTKKFDIIICERCHGTGKIGTWGWLDQHIRYCPDCKGAGKIKQPEASSLEGNNTGNTISH